MVLIQKCVLYGIKTGVRSGVDVCNNGHSECHNNTQKKKHLYAVLMLTTDTVNVIIIPRKKKHLYAILMLLVHLSSC